MVPEKLIRIEAKTEMDKSQIRARRIQEKERSWKRVRRRKLIRNILIMISVVIIGMVGFLKLAPGNIKVDILKGLTKMQFVRNLIELGVGDDFEDKIQDTEFKEEDLAIDAQVETKLSGYTNIALFGIDSRGDSFDSATRSDSIIIVSINNDTGAMKMVSVFRDTFMKINRANGSTVYTKANSAYNDGGATEAVSMLNNNLDLNITDYVVVNFAGLTEIIDLLGGIEVTITDEELALINQYSREMVEESGEDIQVEVLSQSGDVHLNGLQATAYCRIRKEAYYDPTGTAHNGDFGRAARQRLVMEKIITKAKNSGIAKLMELVQQMMNMNTANKTFIKTSMDYDEMMDLIPIMIDYNMVGNNAFPFTLETGTVDGASMVIPKGLAYNVSELHKFLFEDEAYQPSDEVQSISDYIINYTGVSE